MKKVQSSAKQDKALDELYKRYEDRGSTYDSSPAYAEQKSREMNTRASAPRSYKLSSGNAETLKKYKNGVSGARKYMTDRDFANYYRANREYTPGSNVELDTTILLQKIDRERYNKKDAPIPKSEKNDIKAKLKREANRVNPKNGKARPVEKKVEQPKSSPKQTNPSKLKKIAKEAAKTWIPIEERHEERIVEGDKIKIPTNVIIAIIVISISLLLIVGSAVLLGSARNEQNELKDAIESLDKEIAELTVELEKKNENADIAIYAEEVLGMINQEHVNAEYIDSNKTDSVDEHASENGSIITLFQWIFQGLK